jgi:hypothetical protein
MGKGKSNGTVMCLLCIACLYIIFVLIIGIIEAVALNRSSEYKNGCYDMWIAMLITCVINFLCVIGIPCAIITAMNSDNKSSSSGGCISVIALVAKIWIIVIWFSLHNSDNHDKHCYHTYASKYPLLLSMLDLEFVMFWIELALIVIVSCCLCCGIIAIEASKSKSSNDPSRPLLTARLPVTTGSRVITQYGKERIVYDHEPLV